MPNPVQNINPYKKHQSRHDNKSSKQHPAKCHEYQGQDEKRSGRIPLGQTSPYVRRRHMRPCENRKHHRSPIRINPQNIESNKAQLNRDKVQDEHETRKKNRHFHKRSVCEWLLHHTEQTCFRRPFKQGIWILPQDEHTEDHQCRASNKQQAETHGFIHAV